VKLYGKVKANMNENLIANEDEKIYQKRTITSLKIRMRMKKKKRNISRLKKR